MYLEKKTYNVCVFVFVTHIHSNIYIHILKIVCKHL